MTAGVSFLCFFRRQGVSADTTFSTARGARDPIGEGSLTGMLSQGVSTDTTFSTVRGAWDTTIGEGFLTGSMGRASVSRTVVSCQSFSFCIILEGAVVSLSERQEAVPEGALVLSVLMVL